MPPKLRHQIDLRRDLQEILDLHTRGPFEIIRVKSAAANAAFRAKSGTKSLPTLGLDILEADDSPSAVPPSESGSKTAAVKACFLTKGGARSLPTKGLNSLEADDSPSAVPPSVSGSLQHLRAASRISTLQHESTRVRQSFDGVAVVTPSTRAPPFRRKMICTPSASTSSRNNFAANDDILPTAAPPTFDLQPSDGLPSALPPPRIRILWQPVHEFTRRYFPERLAPAGILPSPWDAEKGDQPEPPANFQPGLIPAATCVSS